MATGTYKLLDTGNFQKMEQVGAYRIVRPAAQAVWRPKLPFSEWQSADASFSRFSGGDGKWTIKSRQMPESWLIDVPQTGVLKIRLTDFGHLGIFPEQHSNWERLGTTLSLAKAERSAAPGTAPLSVLNLFAYTGGSTLACARAGASVAHVDASKTSVAWARENAEAAGLAASPIRWLVDDVQKFVAREIRRGSKYHGIILDPPSYGRGPGGESWKVEEMLPPLLDDLQKLLAPDFLFVLLSCHSAGYTPLALTNLLAEICPARAGDTAAEEMIVREAGPSGSSGRALPSGASCLFVRRP